ncbi:MAG: T9SS type A sorting domain-containing protein [Fibrobacterota bacterium]|nr:T9SS type A sorting domain-containing protein [Chitinispirillaceae bacterium]
MNTFKNILTIIVVSAITCSCMAGYSLVKLPVNMMIGDYTCTENYIWYCAAYDDSPNSFNNIGIGRVHVPSQTGLFFTRKEIGQSFSINNCKLAAVDSNFAAALLFDTVSYYNGVQWNTLSNKEEFFDLLATPSSGKFWMLSSHSIVSLDKNGKTETFSGETIGLYDSLHGFTKDIQDNVWVFSRHLVARFDKTSWKVMLQNDAMNFSGINLTLDGKICLLSEGLYYTLTDGLLDTVALPVRLRSGNSNIDERGNEWNQVDSSSNVSLQMITADEKKITFRNAKESGWNNWPEFMLSTPGSALRICGKNVYFRYFSGFYCYDGDPGNLQWKWIPVKAPASLGYDTSASSLLASCDSSMYVRREVLSSPLRSEIFNFKSDSIQILPPVKLVSSTSIFEDHTGTLWALGNKVYRLENSVWTQIQIPSTLSVQRIAEDSQGKVVLIAKTLDRDVNVCVFLRQSGSGWEIVNNVTANLSIARLLVKDLNGMYWSIASDGIYKSSDIYQWTREDKPELFFPETYVSSLIVSSNGNIIAAIQSTTNPDGTADVVRFDGTKWESLGLPSDEVHYGIICGDKSGRILYLTVIRGNSFLSYYDSEGWHTVDDSTAFVELEIDSLNQVWFRSTGGAVYKMPSGNPMVARVLNKYSKSQQLTVNGFVHGIATILYSVDKPADISLEVFTLQGKLAVVLTKEFHRKGDYKINWKNNRAPGTYILRLTTPESVNTVRFRTF